MLFFILGIVCILYYTAIILYAGPRSTFAPFWLTLGLGLSGLGAIWEQLPAFKGRQVAEVIFLGAAAVFFIVFWTVESRIIGAALHKAGNGAEVMIILGAQVQGQRPSKSLYRRVKTGARYLKLNPGTKVIVSGGQGPGEGISEAACMCRLLENLGIERQRIFLEDRSTDTYENIRKQYKNLRYRSKNGHCDLRLSHVSVSCPGQNCRDPPCGGNFCRKRPDPVCEFLRSGVFRSSPLPFQWENIGDSAILLKK